MTTRERIEQDLTKELKARNASAVSTLRMLRAALKNAEIDKMKPLEEADVIDVLGREVKKLRDGLESFVAGGREDLAAPARQEIALLETYLPAQLDDAGLKSIVEQKLQAIGPLTEKDFGRLMKEVMKEAQGRAEGARVSKAVKDALAAAKT
ncbi:MAG TPA: GatB/YqeY domain-containing protein [Patescibacteria group bacterium]|nr:GatB/YqeY domain-containing protein [Patescibacteria group bacterium]